MNFIRGLSFDYKYIQMSLTFILSVWNSLFTAGKQVVKSTRFLVNSAYPETYLFFKDNFTPVNSLEYDITSPTTPRIEWYYNKDTKCLYRGPLVESEESENKKTLNLYSAKIYHGELLIYDISHFFWETGYIGDSVPNLGYWIGVWQLEDRKMLDYSNNFTLQLESATGEELYLDLDFKSNQNNVYWKGLVKPLPKLIRVPLPEVASLPTVAPLPEAAPEVTVAPLPLPYTPPFPAPPPVTPFIPMDPLDILGAHTPNLFTGIPHIDRLEES
jgi:hypothetical protein